MNDKRNCPEGAEGLVVDRSGDVVTVIMDRPEVMNAMTGAMFSEFGRIFRAVSYTHLTLPTNREV